MAAGPNALFRGEGGRVTRVAKTSSYALRFPLRRDTTFLAVLRDSSHQRDCRSIDIRAIVPSETTHLIISTSNAATLLTSHFDRERTWRLTRTYENSRVPSSTVAPCMHETNESRVSSWEGNIIESRHAIGRRTARRSAIGRGAASSQLRLSIYYCMTSVLQSLFRRWGGDRKACGKGRFARGNVYPRCDVPNWPVEEELTSRIARLSFLSTWLRISRYSRSAQYRRITRPIVTGDFD